jgi:hypothetical protein
VPVSATRLPMFSRECGCGGRVLGDSEHPVIAAQRHHPLLSMSKTRRGVGAVLIMCGRRFR